MHRQPPVTGPGLHVVEEAVRALQPTIGHRRPSPELEPIDGQPRSHPSGGRVVALLAVETKGALAGFEGQRVIVEAVSGPAEALERLSRLLGGQHLLEARPAACQSPSASARQHARWAPTAARVSLIPTSSLPVSDAFGRAIVPTHHASRRRPGLARDRRVPDLQCDLPSSATRRDVRRTERRRSRGGQCTPPASSSTSPPGTTPATHVPTPTPGRSSPPVPPPSSSASPASG